MSDPQLATIAHKTVDTFAGIVQRPLTLRNGLTSHNDGKEIVVPFKDLDFYVLVERQLAHILFRSDSRTRAMFVKDFILSVDSLSKKYHVRDTDKQVVQTVMERIIDILESRRIESLWSLLYSGSYEKMRVRLRKQALPLLSRVHDTFFNLMICLDAGLDVPPGFLDRYRPFFEEALQKVERRGFTATLVVARWLVTELVDDILKQDRQGYRTGPDASTEAGQDEPAESPKPEPPKTSTRERMIALQAMANQFGPMPESLEQRYSDYNSGAAGAWEESKAAARTALGLNLRTEGEMETVLARSEAEMKEFLDGVQRQLFEPGRYDDWLRRDSDAVIDFIDILPNDLDALPLSFATPLTPQDKMSVARLRARFMRIIGRRATRLDDVGCELDPQAYMEARITRLPVPFFRTEVRGAGFKAMLLIDRSHSMRGSRTDQVERATRMLLDALDFPFVDVSVWGFQALLDGKVTITRFSPLLETFHTTKCPVDGSTPTHIALKVAIRELMGGSETKHLFLLTDGAPVYAGSNCRLVAESHLRLFVREQVTLARRLGIRVTTILVGTRNGDQIDFDLSDKHIRFMYGSDRHWKMIDETRLGDDLVQAVSDSFLAYLNH